LAAVIQEVIDRTSRPTATQVSAAGTNAVGHAATNNGALQ
jgi:hypothetical protein